MTEEGQASKEQPTTGPEVHQLLETPAVDPGLAERPGEVKPIEVRQGKEVLEGEDNKNGIETALPNQDEIKQDTPQEILPTKGDLPEGTNKQQPAPEKVEADSVRTNKNVIIGQVLLQKWTGKEVESPKLSLDPLPLGLRKKIDVVFVPPGDYQRFIKDFRAKKVNIDEERVILVHGPENSGKFSCAVKIALELLEVMYGAEAGVWLYKNVGRDPLSLLKLASHEDLHEEAAYILQDAFTNNIDLAEFSSSYLSVINYGLRERKAYLILTTTDTPELSLFPVPKINASVRDLKTVLEKHLARYGRPGEAFYVPPELIARTQEIAESLLTQFQNPAHIDSFCRELSRLPANSTTDDLRKLAKEVQAPDQISAWHWFQELEEANARLFAMLVVLFSNVDRYVLMELYTDAVKTLRKDGVANLSDPREIGLEDMLAKIRAEETEEGLIRFKFPALEQEARRQLRNHHSLLWSLSDYLGALIETFKAPEYWEVRRDLGAAIGHLGIHDQRKLNIILEKLAEHPSGGVVATVGYALDEICRLYPEYRPFVIKTLHGWVQSGDPDFMWAVGASIWRIYDGLAKLRRFGSGQQETAGNDALEQVHTVFTSLGKRFNEFNDETKLLALASALQQELEQPVQRVTLRARIERDVAERMESQLQQYTIANLRSLLHAVRQIALSHSPSLVELVDNWLQEEPESNLHILGQMACFQLFKENVKPSLLLEDRHGPFLKLLNPIFAIEREIVPDLINTVLSTLRSWLDQSSEWDQRIYKALLNVVNRVESSAAERLRQGLANIWVESQSKTAIEIGQALLIRFYLLSGIPTALPGSQCGAVIVDASVQARQNNAARLGRHIYSRFEPQTEMYILQMGSRKIVVEPHQSVSSANLTATYPRPRLLYPALSSLEELISQVSFLLVLTWGEIIDLNDVKDTDWDDRLVIAKAQNETESESAEVIFFDSEQVKDPDQISRVLARIEGPIETKLARTFLTLEPDSRVRALREYIELDSDHIESVFPQIEARIRELDMPPTPEQRVDPARLLTSVVLWVGSVDLDRCVSLILDWLNKQEEALFVRAGVMSSNALFRLYANLTPVPSVATHVTLLRLLPSLAPTAYRWEALQAVLYAVRQWAVTSEWSSRLLMQPDGSPGELFALLDRVPADRVDDLSEILDEWVKQGENSADAVPESLQKLSEQLQLHLALGKRQRPPELPEGHSFGLIVVDASSPREETRNDLASMTAEVIHRLNQLQNDRLHLLVYRMGESQPLIIPGDKPEPETLIPHTLGRRPRLLGPILDFYVPGQVAFLLLLVNQPALDEEDWQDSEWNKRVLVYSEAADPPWVKELMLLPWQDTWEKAAQVMVEHLERRIGE